MTDFATGFISDLAGGGIGELINKYGLKGVAKGLKKMGYDAKAINKLTGFLDWNFSSKDPLVGDVANSIDDALGKGTVLDVGKQFKSAWGEGDIDILANGFHVEVKTGKKMRAKQTQKNKNHANAQGNKYILFFPDANDAHIRDAQSQGITIITSLEVLIRTLNGQ